MEYVTKFALGHSPRQTTPPSRHSGYHQSRIYSPDNQPHVHSHRSRTLPLSPVSNQLPHSSWPQFDHGQVPHSDSHEQRQERQDQQSISESAFNRILGEDVEGYVVEQAGVYENAQKRWEEATLEEWVAGADGKLLSSSFRAHDE
jgi:hypothetical protein